MRGGAILLACLAAAACGDDSSAARDPGPLLALESGLLTPGKPVEARLVGPGSLPLLEVLYGSVPAGLELATDGVLRGVPRTAGEYARFTVGAFGADGEPLGVRHYALAVGVVATNLPPIPAATRDGDALVFQHDWGRPISHAFGWDPELRLVWPMRVGPGFTGRALAPAGSDFSVVVAGPGVQGYFVLGQQPLDERTGAVAQLTWAGDADLDLHLVPEPSLELEPVNAVAPQLDDAGRWIARHVIGDERSPGPEVVTLAKDATPGRYALVAAKKGGRDVKLEMWLSLRTRAGGAEVEERFEALFSDDCSGSVRDDIAARRQSYRVLGLVEAGADGRLVFSPAPAGRDPFGGEAR